MSYAEHVEIQENVTLAAFTTLGIGGPARWFVEAHSDDEILRAVEFARSKELALFVLGGGSNLLVADAGFPGLVLHVANRGLRMQDEAEHTIFHAAAGEDWDGLVAAAIAKECAGIECLSGIPGTVGGTPVQNVGAYGQEVASTIIQVRALDRKSLQWVELDNAACHFAYRSSLFNSTARQRYIVTEVTYRLLRNGAPYLGYKDLAEKFQNRVKAPTLAAVRKAVREIRRKKGMLLVAGDADCRSAGSFFKNPVVGMEQFTFIEAKWTNVPHFPAADGMVKIPAAWLIEQAGFPKGYTLGAAGVSRRHTLALINHGDAKATDILALRDSIRQRVVQMFGIVLEQEPVYLS
ncbi:MAG TPA: UDP-N-acetylmuramate dehydrogenase [Acidobacteriaceae bacterium]|jgi:UDP-N-acetylmuramate dehydrogenase|nr:UDP-N-acetylmuramate dehydrogenase [Acidobacteriaceae bacterium]